MKTGYWVAVGVLGFFIGVGLIGLNKGAVGASSGTGRQGPLPQASAPIQTASTDGEAERNFQKGQTAAANKDYDLAISYFNEALRIQPGYREALYRRCWANVLAKKFPDAVSDVTEFIRLAPNDAERCRGLGVRGFVNNLRKDSDAAIRDFSEVLRLGPPEGAAALAYDERGEGYRLKGEYDKAIADCSNAIRLGGKAALLYKNRARSYCGKRMFDRARDDVSVALGLNPDADGYVLRAICHLELGDLRSAFKDGQCALSINPNEPGAHCVLAQCYRGWGDLRRDAYHHQRFIELIQSSGQD